MISSFSLGTVLLDLAVPAYQRKCALSSGLKAVYSVGTLVHPCKVSNYSNSLVLGYGHA